MKLILLFLFAYQGIFGMVFKSTNDSSNGLTIYNTDSINYTLIFEDFNFKIKKDDLKVLLNDEFINDMVYCVDNKLLFTKHEDFVSLKFISQTKQRYFWFDAVDWVKFKNFIKLEDP